MYTYCISLNFHFNFIKVEISVQSRVLYLSCHILSEGTVIYTVFVAGPYLKLTGVCGRLSESGRLQDRPRIASFRGSCSSTVPVMLCIHRQATRDLHGIRIWTLCCEFDCCKVSRTHKLLNR